MAHDHCSDQYGGTRGKSPPARDARGAQPPNARQEQAVRPGIGIEDERIECGGPGDNADPLDPGQQQERSEQIERKCRRDNPSQRNFRRPAFRGEGNGSVAYEHGALPVRRR